MNRLYCILGIALAFAGALAALVHGHDARIRAESRAAAAIAHADSVDAQLVPRERALADTIRVLHARSSRDSAAAAAAVDAWGKAAHPARVVVRVDTLPGRPDTVFAEGIPRLADVVRAGDVQAEACTAAIASCAQRAVALERDTLAKAQRIAALEAARGAITATRSCTVPTLVGGVLGGAAGLVAGRLKP